MGQPIVGHLDPFFFEVVSDVRRGLQAVFGTANEFTLAMSATGSGGMETCVSNFVEAGSKLAVFANGYFCDRMSEMGRRMGANVVRFEKPWGEGYSDGEAREFILREKPNVVGFVHAETSTGVYTSGQAICEAAREVGAFTIADCVTSLGTMPIHLDATGIDVAYSCSQKGMSCPPGLSPVTVSPKALEWLKERKTQMATWYFDLKLLADYFGAARRYHHTAPITSFYAMRESLAAIEEEGVQNRFDRHQRNHLAFIRAMEAMGLEMLVRDGIRLWPLNTVKVPAGVEDLKVRQRMIAKHGIEISGGFGPLAGQIFRVGLMGVLSTEPDVQFLLGAFEEALREEGFTPKASGKEAAQEYYSALAPASA
jgi:alanine-glyoxylate transaminase/serine-glyoxylate transaminase/serine-pyruvate transaminase